MNAFEYLAVLISIVLGLGITNVLSGFASMVRHRDRVTIYWPLLVWMAVLFLIHVQTWWAMFELREVRHWTFGGFLAVVMQPVMLYLATSVLVPDFPAGGAIDLKQAYYRETRWFFAGLIAVLVASLVRTPAVSGRLTNPSDFAAHLLFMSFAALGMFTRNEWVHKTSAVIGSVLYCSYIVALFVQLS